MPEPLTEREKIALELLRSVRQHRVLDPLPARQ